MMVVKIVFIPTGLLNIYNKSYSKSKWWALSQSNQLDEIQKTAVWEVSAISKNQLEKCKLQIEKTPH